MPNVTCGDAEVAYDAQGAGDPLVLIHGTSQDRNAWLLQLPGLTGRYRVILPEMAGSGDTSDGGGPLDVDGLSQQVLAVADAAGAERFHLAGYSLGAVVAAAAAATAPERVRSLSLVCGWATSDAHMRMLFGVWQDLLRESPERFIRYAFAHGFTPEWHAMVGDAVDALVAMAAATVGPGAVRQADLDTRVDISKRLGSITAPTLVIGCTRDQFVPVQHGRGLAAEIAGARYEEIDAGHLVLAERADEITALLAAHLAAAG